MIAVRLLCGCEKNHPRLASDALVNHCYSMGLCCQPGHMNSDNNCHRPPSALWLGHFVQTMLGSQSGYLSMEAVKFPLCSGWLGLRRVTQGWESAGGHTVHRGLGRKIGAALEPHSSVGLPSLFLIPGTQERAQRKSCLCTKCTEEHAGDAWEEGWMSRDGGGEWSLSVSGFGLWAKVITSKFWKKTVRNCHWRAQVIFLNHKFKNILIIKTCIEWWL